MIGCAVGVSWGAKLLNLVENNPPLWRQKVNQNKVNEER